MIEYNGTTPCKIVIPVSGSQELLQYQRALFALLRIPVNKITPQLQKEIKAIYRLLNHLECKKNLGELMELEGFGPEAIKLFQELHDRKRPPACA